MAAAGGSLQPTWDLKRRSRTAQQDEIEQQKALMEKQLKERQQRLSRLSSRLTQSNTGKNNLTMKLKQFEVEQMNAQLEELQSAMAKEEQERKEVELRERRRAQEEQQLAKKTADLERTYKEMDPSAVNPAISIRAQRRRTALLSLKDSIGAEEFAQMEKRQAAEEEKELREKNQASEATVKKLADIESQIKAKERAREQERLLRQKKQLEEMERKLKELETGIDSNQDEIGSEEQLLRELAKRRQEAEARRKQEMDARRKQMLEEDRIRREREEALMSRKLEMERKVREMEQALAEKQREKEEDQLRKQAEKVARMEQQLRDLDSGVTNDDLNNEQMSLEYRTMQKRMKEMEAELSRRKNGEEQALDDKMRQLREKEAMLMALEAKNSKLDALFDKLGQLDKLDQLFNKINAMAAGGFAMGGGGGGGGGGAPRNNSEELKKEIESLQAILFNPNSTEKEIADANIKLEKAMSDYEKTPEYQMEVAKQKAEKRAKHEPLNKAALAKMKQIYNPQSVKQNPELLQKIGENPELRFLFMEPETIMKLHQSDFKAFSLRGLGLEELRAIRACLPAFRKDQKVQADWMEGLDNKIEEMSQNGEVTKKEKKAPNPNAPKLKIKTAPAGGGGGDIFAELLARKGQAGGGGGGGPPPAPTGAKSMPPLPGSAPKNPALPPLPGKGPALPPLPGKGPALPPLPPTAGGPPPPPKPAASGGGAATGEAPPMATLDQFKKVKGCLEKLLKGLASAQPNEKEIAQDTRVAVSEIKLLAKLQKAKYPEAANDVEDSASELVVAVKAVLVARKTGGAELQTAKSKLAQCIDQVRNQCVKVLGPGGAAHVK